MFLYGLRRASGVTDVEFTCNDVQGTYPLRVLCRTGRGRGWTGSNSVTPNSQVVCARCLRGKISTSIEGQSQRTAYSFHGTISAQTAAPASGINVCAHSYTQWAYVRAFNTDIMSVAGTL